MLVKNLPKKVAIFPLSGVVFFPKTILPLNIFEKRYIQLIEDCMKKQKIFGMVQPKLKKEVYNVGCLGKIISFSETDDNRFLIALSGIIRFKIEKELETIKLYREFEVNYSDFISDLETKNNLERELENKNLINKIKLFLKKKNYLINFNELEKLNFDQLINTICMMSPFSIEEKQKLIETVKIQDKINVLNKIIDLYLVDNFENKTLQ